jgi:hypothetical protein
MIMNFLRKTTSGQVYQKRTLIVTQTNISEVEIVIGF